MSALRVILIALVLSLPTLASAQWSENGRPISDSDWRKTDGNFGAMLMVTDDLQSFLDQWSKPAAPGYRPNLSTTETARRGDTVAAEILFSSCTPTEAGLCRAVVDFKVTRPDGSVYAEHKGAPLWSEAPPRVGHLQLGVAQLAFEVESDDPLGTYYIETTVRDMVALRSVALTRSLTVAAASPAASSKPAP